MFQTDHSNTVFRLAAELVNETSRNIFLTGKAGTGKTTFLKQVTEHPKKNTIIIAPTGVAAINAGGVTMHSFFQLPRGMFIPGTMKKEGLIGFAETTDRHSLFRNIHFSGEKRRLIQEMELLIIDEVSMVRCDMLDAVDLILRHFRKAVHLPFGGVQVLFIGDMYQLPPVVMQEEWKILSEYYASPFFFDAKVMAEAPPVYIELKKIYRQNERDFIELLNRIRNNDLRPQDFNYLNGRYQPDFSPGPQEQYITLTTHNRKADLINAEQLSKLPGKMFSFEASIKMEFSDKAFPTDRVLRLKPGAQVMFIKNDSGAERRYFNGKLARVSRITEESVSVVFSDTREELELEKETWKNLRYIYNNENDQIDEEELGSFTQFPIRLAWAITVHKSQGLTFEKAVIDAGESFAPGQVYVALSRCVSMEGLVLKSRISSQAISMDSRIIHFAKREVTDISEIELTLEQERMKYASSRLKRLFNWEGLVTNITEWKRDIPNTKLPDIPAATSLAEEILNGAKELSIVGKKFQQQLEFIIPEAERSGEKQMLKERVEKAMAYFVDAAKNKIIQPLSAHLDAIQFLSRVLKYRTRVLELRETVTNHFKKFSTVSYGQVEFTLPDLEFNNNSAVARKGRKQQKGASNDLSYQLFLEGKSMEEIAAIRNLALSTIQGHLAPFVKTGQIEATVFVPAERIEKVMEVISEIGIESASKIKSRLSDDYSFHEIRIVMNHYLFYQKRSA